MNILDELNTWMQYSAFPWTPQVISGGSTFCNEIPFSTTVIFIIIILIHTDSAKHVCNNILYLKRGHLLCHYEYRNRITDQNWTWQACSQQKKVKGAFALSSTSWSYQLLIDTDPDRQVGDHILERRHTTHWLRQVVLIRVALIDNNGDGGEWEMFWDWYTVSKTSLS